MGQEKQEGAKREKEPVCWDALALYLQCRLIFAPRFLLPLSCLVSKMMRRRLSRFPSSSVLLVFIRRFDLVENKQEFDQEFLF